MSGLEALLLIGLAVGIYINTQQKAAENLVYFPGNAGIPTGFAFEGATPVLTGELIVQNTSNVDFTINSLAGNVSTDGTLVGNISNFEPVTIRANSQAKLPLHLALFPYGIVDNIINSFFGGAQKRELLIDGSANANGQQVAINLKYTVGG